jgi:hypothetical protein
MTTSGSIIIPKPTPHLVTTNTISSTEYYRYDDVLNDVDDDQQDGEHNTPQLKYDDSMDTTMDHVSVSSVAAPPPTTVNCIHTTTTSSCSSIKSRFQVLKEKYLAPASPERASGKWMLMNAFCLVWSLSLGVYILLLYIYYDEFEQQQDDDNDDTDDGSGSGSTIDNPASRESTTDYLLWSLLTCFVWIIEVALRIAFPAVDTVIKVVKSRSNDNLDAAATAAAESIRSIITVETIVEHRNKKQITIIILELILAAYFVLQTIQDCYKHWKTHHYPRYQNDDENVNVSYADYYDYFDTDEDEDARAGGGIVVYTILEQEVDVWVAVFAYAYMTYETYQKYYKIASTEHNIQRSLTNLTYGTIMGDDPPPHDKDDRKQQQQQRQPICGNDNANDNNNDNDNEDNVKDGRNKKEEEDKGNTALLREVNVRVAKAENCNDDDDDDVNDDIDDDNNSTPPAVHLQTIV